MAYCHTKAWKTILVSTKSESDTSYIQMTSPENPKRFIGNINSQEIRLILRETMRKKIISAYNTHSFQWCQTEHRPKY